MKKPLIVGTIVMLVGGSLGLWTWNMAYAPTLVNDDAFIFIRYAVNWVDYGTDK